MTKIAQKWQFFSFLVVFFSYTPSLSVTYFFTVLNWFIRFEMVKYAQKYEKGLFFLFFLIFCQKLPTIGHFFHFQWSIFFSHTPSISVTYFFTVTGSSGLKCSNMHKNMKKARFSYFSWFFVKNCQKMAIFFISSGQFFFTHTLTICDLLFYSFGLVHQV